MCIQGEVLLLRLESMVLATSGVLSFNGSASNLQETHDLDLANCNYSIPSISKPLTHNDDNVAVHAADL